MQTMTCCCTLGDRSWKCSRRARKHCLQVLGRALKDLPREDIIVATKVGRYGSNTFDFSAERVTKSVYESLERLQVSKSKLLKF
jgi:aryl-alcohol dehydrogenase-like predicted oxidoreductase